MDNKDKIPMNNFNEFQKAKVALDAVSPSFCMAKWNQVTIHLGAGLTHSCHHPAAHKIPIDEIRKLPSALHNTEFKKQQRKLMLEGQRPKECDYCWKVEDAQIKKNESNVFSDRYTKSAEKWAAPFVDTVKQLPWDANVNPTYLEVSFDTTCNFKCAYCSPSFSSTWRQEIEQHGPYQLQNQTLHSLEYMRQTDTMPMPITKPNPYIDAFWEWWPDAVKDLHVFRITGGEPLLSKQVFRVLDYLIENPQPQMEFNINSNLDVPQDLMNLFIQKMSVIQEKKAVKSFKLYTSNEAHGKQAEYIRFGLNYDRWLNNCNRVLGEIPDSQLTVMAAFNLLSIPSFKLFMDDIVALKFKYTEQPHRKNPVSLDVPYVRWPEFLAPWVVPFDDLPKIEDAVSHMYKNLQQMHWPPLCGKGFFDYEVNRFERLYYVIREQMIITHSNTDKINELRAQFAEYITEYDLRRGTDFTKTFPEYAEFYITCKKSTKRWINGGPY
jgi:organic radical activating enzyme